MEMNATERAINDLNTAKLILCNPQMLTPEMCVKIGHAINSAIDLLTKQEKEIESLNVALENVSQMGHY